MDDPETEQKPTVQILQRSAKTGSEAICSHAEHYVNEQNHIRNIIYNKADVI